MKKLKWWILGISAASVLSLLVAMGVIFTLFSGSLNGHNCDSSDNPSHAPQVVILIKTVKNIRTLRRSLKL